MKKVFWILVLLIFALLATEVFAAGLDINQSNYEPAPVQPGKKFDLWLHVKNTSFEPLDDAVLELVAGYPFSIGDQPNVKTLGTIGANQIVLVKYEVSVDASAGEGTYNLDARLSSKGKLDRVAAIPIMVKGKKPVVDLTEGSVIRAGPGDEVEAVFTIKNIGASAANDIVVKIEEDRTVTSSGVVVERQIVPLGATSVYVSSLDAGAEAEVKMLLGINSSAELKSYFMPLKIKYYDQDRNEFTTTAYLGIKVTAAPELDVVLGQLIPRAFLGGTSEVRFDIFNTGIATARYVVAQISASGLEFADSKQFISTLEADDFDSFRSEMIVPLATQPGQHQVIVNLTYKDQENQARTVTKVLYVEVYPDAGAAADPTLAMLGALLPVAIIIVLAWLVYKNRGRLGLSAGGSAKAPSPRSR